MVEHRHASLYRKSTHLYELAEQADLLESGPARVVLVEGPLDAVAVSLAGCVGLAAGGTALTGDHAAQLLAVTSPARPRHVAYDGAAPFLAHVSGAHEAGGSRLINSSSRASPVACHLSGVRCPDCSRPVTPWAAVSSSPA